MEAVTGFFLYKIMQPIGHDKVYTVAAYIFPFLLTGSALISGYLIFSFAPIKLCQSIMGLIVLWS